MKTQSMSTAVMAAVSAVALLVMASAAHAGATFEAVKKKGFVQCGVNVGLPGFSAADEKGVWTGIDVDVCRAVAAMVFGDANKVKYTPLTAKERFTALATGEVDVLSRNATWTETRDGGLGISFTGVTYYDGQGFLIKKKLGVKSARKLSGAAVCVLAGTTTELNLADYFRANKMKFKAVTYDTSDETSKAFDAGRCDVLTSDQSQLYALRLKLAKPNDAAVLPEIISKEPLGPAVRQGDEDWFKIVRWALFAMVNAEELGITSKNIDQMKGSDNPEVKRLLGTEQIKHGLGVKDDWAYQIVKQVGNYGESFDRNVGKGSPLKIERGLNALWNNGGIQYAPPIR